MSNKNDFEIVDGKLISYHGNDVNVVIPDGVTSIRSCVFENCKNIKSVTIPDGVAEISLGMFHGCDSLTSIVIPDSVTRIGTDAFRGCTSLESITIPDSVTSIDNHAFSDCTALKNITIPESVTKIPTAENSVNIQTFLANEAFKNCPIENATLPASLAHCMTSKELTDVTISSGNIGDGAFRGMVYPKIESVVIQEGVTSIGKWSFEGQSHLSTVTIPDSVTRIGEGAFESCANLKSVELGNGVTEISKNAFRWCPELQEIHAPAHLIEQLRQEYPNVSIVPNEMEKHNLSDLIQEGRALVPTDTLTLVDSSLKGAIVIDMDEVKHIRPGVLDRSDITTIVAPESLREDVAHAHSIRTTTFSEIGSENIREPLIMGNELFQLNKNFNDVYSSLNSSDIKMHNLSDLVASGDALVQNGILKRCSPDVEGAVVIDMDVKRIAPESCNRTKITEIIGEIELARDVKTVASDHDVKFIPLNTKERTKDEETELHREPPEKPHLQIDL